MESVYSRKNTEQRENAQQLFSNKVRIISVFRYDAGIFARIDEKQGMKRKMLAER
ncbi:hypothetical protein BBOR36S_01346 [Brevibacillus borstelensis]|jgi:hypothetical protein